MFRVYAAGQRRSFVYAILLLAAEAATAVAIPALIGLLINILGGEDSSWSILGLEITPSEAIPLLAAALVAVTAVNSMADSLAEISLAKAGRTFGFNLRGALFEHLQKLSLTFHLRRSTGDVLTRMTGDVKELEEFIVDSVSDLLGSVMLLVGTLAYLFWQSWNIALLALVIIPLLTVVSSFFARRIKIAQKDLRAREGDLASTAQEMLTTVSVVQTYGRAEHEQRKFAKESGSAMQAVLRTARLEAAFSFTVSVLEAVVIAAVVLIGARWVTTDVIAAGTLVAIILLIQGMFKPTRKIVKEWNTVAKIYASVERIDDLFARTPSVFDLPTSRPAPALRGDIEFRDVSFAYQPQGEEDADGEPARLTLQSLSFQVPAGDVVALVGHSGAGKSTIAQLLPRLYDPHAGAVLFDGHDIRGFTLESLRAQISIVLQETILLRGTVAYNIAYGRAGSTIEDVVAAAKQANAHEFIMAMPDGYDTMLGERAATLSGGQRQRLAIARAFIRDTPILIMDEPTTGLDAESAHLVAEALRTLSYGRSTVIVSHDLSLIRDVDRILVISAGRVLEEGTSGDLLVGGGLFAQLYARQFGEEAPAAVPAPAAPAEEAFAGSMDEEPDTVTATFESELTDATPRPASRAQFQALTGWAPVRTPRAQPDHEFDPLRSPGLTRLLPGLESSLDVAVMTPQLQQILADPWVVDSCAPGKAFVEPDAGATLRYRLRLRNRDTGEIVERLVGGRLFTSEAQADAWDARSAPLADALDGRDDLRAFARTTSHVRSLRIALHAFPLDPDLPGLVRLSDPRGAAETLGPVVDTSVSGLDLQDCHVEVVRYGRRGTCVLRYELTWRLGATRRNLKQVLYGKVYADRSGELVGPAVSALRRSAEDGPGRGFPFLVPRLHAYLPDLRLALLDALPGAPQLSSLVRDPSPPDGATGLTLERALHSCARVAAALHDSAIPVGETRTLEGEIARARSEIESIASLAPELASTLHDALAPAVEATREPGATLGVAHGDLVPAHVLLDGPVTSVVSFDSVCSGRARAGPRPARRCAGPVAAEGPCACSRTGPWGRAAELDGAGRVCTGARRVGSGSARLPHGGLPQGGAGAHGRTPMVRAQTGAGRHGHVNPQGRPEHPLT